MKDFESYVNEAKVSRETKEKMQQYMLQKKLEKAAKRNDMLACLAMTIAVLLFAGILFYYSGSSNMNVEDETEQQISEPVEVIQDIQADLTNYSISHEMLFPPEPSSKTYTAVFKATAYCSCEKCCGIWAKNRGEVVIGAAGVELIEGYSIAVDDSLFEYGQIFVDNNGNEYRADDCGGAIQGNRIDVYFNSHQRALEFGVQEIELTWTIDDEIR